MLKLRNKALKVLNLISQQSTVWRAWGHKSWRCRHYLCGSRCHTPNLPKSHMSSSTQISNRIRNMTHSFILIFIFTYNCLLHFMPFYFYVCTLVIYIYFFISVSHYLFFFFLLHIFNKFTLQRSTIHSFTYVSLV